MEAKDLEQFVKIMRALARVFTNNEPDQLTLDLYFEILKKYDIQAVSGAAYDIIKTRVINGMPKPAEFLDRLENRKSRGLIAWMEIEKSRYSSKPTGDKIADHVWTQLISRYASLEDKDIPWIQKEFERRYNALYDNPSIGHSILTDQKVMDLLPNLLKPIDDKPLTEK